MDEVEAIIISKHTSLWNLTSKKKEVVTHYINSLNPLVHWGVKRVYKFDYYIALALTMINPNDMLECINYSFKGRDGVYY